MRAIDTTIGDLTATVYVSDDMAALLGVEGRRVDSYPSGRPVEHTDDGTQCADCGSDIYQSTCDACPGWACVDCATGCDLDFAGPDSACLAAWRVRRDQLDSPDEVSD